MPRIARTLGLAMGLIGGMAASQGPEFAQQYRQRLGGAIDELNRIVARFDGDAAATGRDRAGAVEDLRRNADPLVSRQGDAMRANVERRDRLQRQQQDFASAGPFARLIVFAREADTDLAAATFRDFEPAVPTTSEGFLTAGLGFALAYALSRLIGTPLRRAFFRRGSRVRAA